MDRPRYSFVIPIYNEEETLPELARRVTYVMDGLDGEAEAILVDDGSTDRSYELLVDRGCLHGLAASGLPRQDRSGHSGVGGALL